MQASTSSAGMEARMVKSPVPEAPMRNKGYTIRLAAVR